MTTQAHQDVINHAAQCGTTWPHQYALDNGWDADAIAAIAERGAPDHDVAALGADAAKELAEWCRKQSTGFTQ